MLVWRLEGPDGRGPFRPQSGPSPVRNVDLGHTNEMPTMSRDWPPHSMPVFDSNERWEYYCGVPSKQALLEWFPKSELKQLIERFGYRVRVYRPTQYVVGNSGMQVFFKK